MRNNAIYLLAASCFAAAVALASPAWAANPLKPNKPGVNARPAASTVKPAKPAVTAAKAAGPKEYGGPMPLPVDQRIERQNSPEDKLVVEITHSAVVGGTHVAYVKIVWGDLDNLIKTGGKQFYSNWDGNLKLTPDATGAIDEKIQFDDGSKAKANPKPVTPAVAKSAAPKDPKAGSGRDAVDIKSGPTMEWDAGVVGALDGLRIKITSPDAAISGTLVAGKFTIPINITPGSGATPPAGATPVRPVPARGPSTLLQVH